MALVDVEAGEAALSPAGRGPGLGLVRLAERLTTALETERPHWFTWVPVFLGLGIGLYFWLPVEPTMGVALAVPVAAAALWAALPRGGIAAALALGGLAAAGGFALAKARTEATRAPVLEKRLGNVEVAGWVTLVEGKPKRGGRITLAVTRIAGVAPEATPARVRVRTMAPVAGLKIGEPVRIRATLSPPAAPALPGTYDFARAAWYQRLGGVGYSLAAPVADPDAPIAPLALRVGAGIERLRAAIGARITAGLPGETGAIANAMITGERGAITEATNDAFRDSGLFHALSISGLHMAVMAGAIFLSLRTLLAAIPALALRFSVKKWAAVGAALGALFYLLISGASPATQRSYLMISIMFLAVLLDRQALALRNIALSALLILVVFPESLLDLGFQMSYAAVAALIAAHELIQARLPRHSGAARGDDADGAGLLERMASGALGGVTRVGIFFVGIAASTIIASLAVAPFAAFYFHKSQPYAILGNVLGLPICDLFVMPLALAVLVAMPFGLEAGPLWAMGIGVDALVWSAKTVAALPGAVATVRAMPDAAFLLMVAGGLWLVLWGGRARLLGVAPIAAGLALAPFAARPDILVSQDGRTIAARIDGTRLSALPVRGRSFELQRWLEHDGDGRALRDVARGDGFRCDAAGCTARVRGLTLAVAQTPSALVDDCARARILVLAMPRPEACTGPAVVLDLWALRDRGTHAIAIAADGSIAVETVADVRGARPWSQSGLGRAPPPRLPSLEARERARVGSFAAPELFARYRRGSASANPEAEDDDAAPEPDDRP